jgi:hypothetical protein
VIFPDAGPPGVFLGEREKTIAQQWIGAIAGETAATLGLFAKVERLIHRGSLATRRESALLGLSVTGALELLPTILKLYRFYVR